METREFTSEDYAAYGELLDAVYPDYPGQLAETRHRDEHRPPHCRWWRWLVWRDDRILAAAEYLQNPGMFHPRKFNVEIQVRPELAGRGLGSRLWTMLMDALGEFDPIELRCLLRDDNPAGLRFAAARGFRETLREIESVCRLADYDPAAGAVLASRLAESGVSLFSLPELAPSLERDREIYDLREAIVQDVPGPAEHTAEGFDIWRERFFSNPMLVPEATIIAVAEGRYVGFTNLYQEPEGLLYTGLTGLRRPWRGRGIAQALKHRALRWAKAAGREKVMTWNESDNQGILAINRKVGFDATHAWISLSSDLGQSDDRMTIDKERAC